MYSSIPVWRPPVRPGACVVEVLGAGHLRGWLVAPVVSHGTFPVRGPLYSGLFLSRARPSPRAAPRLPLLLSIQVHRGGSNPPCLSSHPDVGGTPSIRPGSVLSVCLST